MPNCNDPSNNGFPNAGSMASMSTNWPVVWAEIGAIQQAILLASSQCPYPCNGQGGTPGTGGNTEVCVSGISPMTFVSGITGVTVVNGGTGYYTDTPAVRFIPPYGVTIAPVNTATGSVTTNGSSVTGITVTPGSSGYQPRYTTAVVNSLTGTGAVLSVATDAMGTVYSITVVSPGSGYTNIDSVNVIRALAPNPLYINAVASIGALDLSGGILAVNVSVHGSGYSPSVTQAEIVSSLNTVVPYITGLGFQSNVLTSISGEITGVIIVNGGAGFAPLPPKLIVSDSGSGIEANVILNGMATIPPGNSISSISVTATGNNYTQSATATVVNPSTAPAPTLPATVTLTIPVNTFCTNPTLYYQVWQGSVTNSAIQAQLDFVKTYFVNLGYNFSYSTNPETGNTLSACVCW